MYYKYMLRIHAILLTGFAVSNVAQPSQPKIYQSASSCSLTENISKVSLDDKYVYIVQGKTSITIREIASCTAVREYQYQRGMIYGIVVANYNLYFVLGEDTSLPYTFGLYMAEVGKSEPTKLYSGNRTIRDLTVVDNTVLFLADDTVYCINAADGRLRWTRRYSAMINEIQIRKDKVVQLWMNQSYENGRHFKNLIDIEQLDLETGATTSRYPIQDANADDLCRYDGVTIFRGSGGPNIYIEAGGKISKLIPKMPSHSEIVGCWNNQVYIATLNQEMIRYDVARRKITRHPGIYGVQYDVRNDHVLFIDREGVYIDEDDKPVNYLIKTERNRIYTEAGALIAYDDKEYDIYLMR